jgi:hypothetical protein
MIWGDPGTAGYTARYCNPLHYHLPSCCTWSTSVRTPTHCHQAAGPGGARQRQLGSKAGWRSHLGIPTGLDVASGTFLGEQHVLAHQPLRTWQARVRTHSGRRQAPEHQPGSARSTWCGGALDAPAAGPRAAAASQVHTSTRRYAEHCQRAERMMPRWRASGRGVAMLQQIARMMQRASHMATCMLQTSMSWQQAVIGCDTTPSASNIHTAVPGWPHQIGSQQVQRARSFDWAMATTARRRGAYHCQRWCPRCRCDVQEVTSVSTDRALHGDVRITMCDAQQRR